MGRGVSVRNAANICQNNSFHFCVCVRLSKCTCYWFCCSSAVCVVCVCMLDEEWPALHDSHGKLRAQLAKRSSGAQGICRNFFFFCRLCVIWLYGSGECDRFCLMVNIEILKCRNLTAAAGGTKVELGMAWAWVQSGAVVILDGLKASLNRLDCIL